MTIDQVITKVDNQKPNAYTKTEKIDWLSELDGMIKAEVIDTHEGGDQIFFDAYCANDGSLELLAEAPYDSMYIHWLEAKIDYANAEYNKYNNSMAMFQTKYRGFCSWYNRRHMPIETKFVYF